MLAVNGQLDLANSSEDDGFGHCVRMWSAYGSGLHLGVEMPYKLIRYSWLVSSILISFIDMAVFDRYPIHSTRQVYVPLP